MTTQAPEMSRPAIDPAIASITAPPADPPPSSGRITRLWRGRREDPSWVRPALYLLLASTAALYLIDLSASGYANDFYAAAVKSGTESVKAWLFGSLDSGNAITVDKPPAAMWLMVLSARVFGFSSFSMLLPQALMGVGTVGLTYAAVRRWSGPGAGLIAGALITTVPAAALIFRFNNPDALLVLLMTAAGYLVVRAIERSDTSSRKAMHWLLLAGAALGFAFLTKMLQGLLVLPALGLAYLVAAKLPVWRRIWHLLAAAGALIVAAGWFIVLVALWPAAARPYIGGSENNSLWELAIGYNGLGRIFGASAGGGGGGGFGGATGLGRLFGTEFGTHISWLIPAAVIGLVAGLLFTLRLPRTDRIRASLILWGGSMLVTALVFSYMSGIIHPYYTVALAPSIAATIAVAGTELWRGRENFVVRLVLSSMMAITGIWSFILLGRDASGWQPWLRWVTLIGALVGAALLAVSVGSLKRLAAGAVLVGTLTALSGTAAYAIATASTTHSGSIPSVGPAGYSSSGMGGMGGMAGERGDFGAGRGQEGQSDGAALGGDGDGSGGGGQVSSTTELTSLLDGTSTRWSAAVIGDQTAAGYILSGDTAVMAIGGWSGSDPAPTLAEFQQYVADGDISYFIAGSGAGGVGGGPGGGGSGAGSGAEITEWVQANFTASTVGNTTVYDLTAGSNT